MALGTSKPVCYYQFENNANDTSNAGNGMNGTMVGGSYETAEKVRGSYSYKGDRDALPVDCIHSCGDYDDISFINSGVFTISYWTKLQYANSSDYVMGTDVGGGAKNILIGWVSKKIRFKRYGHPSDADVDWYSDVTTAGNDTTAFHHIVITCDGSNMKFYVDGALDSTRATAAWSAGTMGCTLMLGGGPNTTCSTPWSYNYRGYLDEVSLWDETATADEVASLYNSGAGLDLSDGLGGGGGLPSGLKDVGGVSGDSVKMIGGVAAANVKTIMGIS